MQSYYYQPIIIIILGYFKCIIYNYLSLKLLNIIIITIIIMNIGQFYSVSIELNIFLSSRSKRKKQERVIL